MQGAVRHVGCPKDCNSMRMMENCLKFGEYVAVDDNGHTARCNGKQEVYGGMHNRTSCQAYCAVYKTTLLGHLLQGAAKVADAA